jgi:hypothetical protein
VTGLVLRQRGGGYSPVCLTCGMRLRVVVALRSTAALLLDDHGHAVHGWAA